jgi:hypothetical protein
VIGLLTSVEASCAALLATPLMSAQEAEAAGKLILALCRMYGKNAVQSFVV